MTARDSANAGGTVFTRWCASVVLFAATSALAQRLNLDPPAPVESAWTCTAPLAANATGPFGELAARLLKAPATDDAEAARRLVLALTLKKIPEDPAYAALPAERRAEIEARVAGIDGVSVIAAAEQLASLLTDPERAKPAWAVPPLVPLPHAPLAPLLVGAGDEILAAAAAIDAQLASHTVDPASVLAGVDTRAIAVALALPEAMFPARTRERFVDALGAAVVEARAGRADRLAMLGEIAAAGPQVKSLKGVSSIKAGKSYEQLLRAAPDLPPEETRRRLARLAELCHDARTAAPTIESLKLARQLRPAHGQLLPEYRAAQRTIAPVALRLLDPGESLNDPGIIRAEEPFAACLEDLRALGRISAAVTVVDAKGRETLAAEAKPACDAILLASKLIARAKDRDREDVLNSFRRLCRRVEAATTLPDERSLRAETEVAVAEFVGKYEDVRARYLVALASKRREPDPALVSALEVGREILEFRERVRIVDTDALLAWPGFEATPEGLASIRHGIDEQVLGAMRAFNADRYDRASDLVKAGPTRFAAAVAIADLSRAIVVTGSAAPVALREAIPGTPDTMRCPGARHRGAFEFIALCGEELAALRAAGEDTKAVEDRMNAAAAPVRIDAGP